MLIDIHTHNRSNEENQLEIVVDEDTLGIHPWNIDKIPTFSKNRDQCLMIGETGLDRSEKYKTSFLKQEKIFRIHLDLAKKYEVPVVIHSVRAHSDVLRILKSTKFTGKILIHDFSGNLDQIKAYLSFDSYFSFRRNFEVMKQTPVERVFLETDDQIKFNIKDIYIQSEIKEQQIEKNFLAFFSNTKYVRSADVLHDLGLALNSY
jgi:TatD DNase family protein